MCALADGISAACLFTTILELKFLKRTSEHPEIEQNTKIICSELLGTRSASACEHKPLAAATLA